MVIDDYKRSLALLLSRRDELEIMLKNSNYSLDLSLRLRTINNEIDDLYDIITYFETGSHRKHLFPYSPFDNVADRRY